MLLCAGLVGTEIIKLALLLARGPSPMVYDAAEYWNLGVAAGRGDLLLLSEAIAYRTPVYPWFLALVQNGLGGSALCGVILLQYVLVLATSLLTAKIVWRTTRTPWAVVLALFLSAVAVARPRYASTVLTETFFTFLLVVHLDAVIGYCWAPQRWRAMWAGASLALCLLTRPIAMMLWLVHAGLLLLLQAQKYQKRRPRGRSSAPVVRGAGRLDFSVLWKHVAIAAFVVMLLVYPWMLRNRLMFGRHSVTEFFGRNIWITAFQDEAGANLPMPATDAAGELRAAARKGNRRVNWVHNWSVSQALVKSGFNDAEADRLMRRVAMEAIEQDPLHFGWKTIQRTGNFFRTTATDLPGWAGANESYGGQQTWHLDLPIAHRVAESTLSSSLRFNEFVFAVVVVSLGVLVVHPQTRPWGLWYGAILAYFAILTGLLEIPNYRYRAVLEPVMIIIVATALAAILNWRLGRRDWFLPS